MMSDAQGLADLQKFRHRSQPGAGLRGVDTGLWRFRRHPNYFGELACWWALWLLVGPDLGWLALVALVGPVTITVVSLWLTGIPTLERSGARS